MSRTWKWIISLAVLLIVAAISVPIVLVARFAGQGGAVRAEIDRIKAEGAPTSAADLAGRPIPDPENAAVVYQKCFAYLPESLSSSPDGNVLGDFLNSGKRAASPKLWSQARTIVARYENALVLADKASEMRRCKFHVEWAKPFEYKCPHHAHLRHLAFLFWARALVLAKGGDTAGALRSVESVFALSQALEREPGMIAALTRWAILSIASVALDDVCKVGSFREAQARRLSDAIGAITLSGGAVRSLEEERALGIVGFDEIRHGRFPLISNDLRAADTVMRVYKKPSSRAVINLDEAVYLREMKAAIAHASLPYRLHPPSVRNCDEPHLPRYALFASILLPMTDGSETRSQDRAVAHLDGSRLLLGLLAYRDHFGTYPASLRELAKLSWRRPLDPFSGKPFVYHRQGRGFILYSIGDDLKDNGGIDPGDIVWKLAK